MEILSALFDGILIALQPINLGLAVVGVIVGLFVGAMPGLGYRQLLWAYRELQQRSPQLLMEDRLL